MSTIGYYPKSPITEGIIDLRIASRSGIQLNELESIRYGEEKSYPKLEKIYEAVGLMEVQAGISTSASAHQNQIGYKFISDDDKYICQTSTNGFTLSRLAPYESWENFRQEAKRLWTIYYTKANPERVTRLAVRYINRIDIPVNDGYIDLKQYFRTSPEISTDLPQHMKHFFMRLNLPQEDLKGQVLINQTVISPAREGVVSVVLDIDLFRDHDIPIDNEGIWQLFEALRIRKNEIFEACITDQARRLFQ